MFNFFFFFNPALLLDFFSYCKAVVKKNSKVKQKAELNKQNKILNAHQNSRDSDHLLLMAPRLCMVYI